MRKGADQRFVATQLNAASVPIRIRKLLREKPYAAISYGCDGKSLMGARHKVWRAAVIGA